MRVLLHFKRLLLTAQIDRLRSKQNVLILTTSNVTAAIDTAFIDRADIKAFIGLPPPKARYTVLATCVQELVRVGLVHPAVPLLGWGAAHPLWLQTRETIASTQHTIECTTAATSRNDTTEAPVPQWLGQLSAEDVRMCLAASSGKGGVSASLLASVLLAAVAEATQGLSGRALRKLPFQAHAAFAQGAGAQTMSGVLMGLLRAALLEQRARKDLSTPSSTIL
jgi:SpoVK/Ycf46/Vps4 family AAA+-type ATPase